MELKIINQFSNPLLHREEYSVSITSDSAPSFSDVKKSMGKDDEMSVVKSVEGNFGRHSFNAFVVVYDSKENKKLIEKISRKERKKIAEEAKKAESAQAAPTA